MLQPKSTFAALIILSLAFCPKAGAGLYGFSPFDKDAYKTQELSSDVPPRHIVNYRDLMRENVNMLVEYAKKQNPNFVVIAHEGQELLDKSLWEYHLDGYNNARKFGINAKDASFLVHSKDKLKDIDLNTDIIATTYLKNLDAIALNNLFCQNSPRNKIATQAGLKVISIDQCASEDDFDEAIQESVGEQVLLYGFTDISKAFNNIKEQPVINGSAENITSIKQAHNILFLTDDSQYNDKFSFLEDLRNSSQDVVIINPLFHHSIPFSKEEIQSLKFKKNGTSRLLIAQMNISEADKKSYYWQKNWKTGTPAFLERESYVNQDSMITKYWQEEWRQLIARHFKDIIVSGFDGVFFTGLENSRLFEQQTPLE